MKNIKIWGLFFTSIISLNSISQTFRSGFDNLDYSSSGGLGQGASFQSNVIGILYNNETVVLQGYLNMFKATKDKRYLDKFIIHTKRVQERRDDNIHNISSQVSGFIWNIEGNTLDIIDLQKDNETLKKEIDELKEKIEALEKKLESK